MSERRQPPSRCADMRIGASALFCILSEPTSSARFGRGDSSSLIRSLRSRGCSPPGLPGWEAMK